MNSTASRRVLFTVLFSLSAALGARAQISNVWNGGGADNNWTNGLNWVGGVAPANPSTNFVTLAGATRLTPAVNAGWTVLGLSIATNAGAFTQSGSNLTITGNAPGGVGPNIFVHSGPTNVVINADDFYTEADTKMRYGNALRQIKQDAATLARVAVMAVRSRRRGLR